jgi:hypothetical protein
MFAFFSRTSTSTAIDDTIVYDRPEVRNPTGEFGSTRPRAQNGTLAAHRRRVRASLRESAVA